MTTSQNYEVREVPIADTVYIKTGLFAQQQQIITELQCTSNDQMETLLSATLRASLTRLSPFKLFFMTLNSIIQYFFVL